ncbi:unnamed protein product [Adineta steineri]|uniref:Uncharacterized protein n=1 Tax=Adineta steineri TaxID=433720 RepID=A0A813VEP9_9BILA|nr:unnamed protein product [Adineta steineri]
MRLLAPFAVLLVSIAFAQSQLVVPQINNLNAVISLLPQLQGFLGQLNNILPQLTGVLSSSELHSLKDKLIQFVVAQLGSNLDLNAIKDKIRPILQHFLASKPQRSFDFDQLLQQIVGATTEALPSIILNMVGKRDATDARINVNDILQFVNNNQIQNFIPQIQQFLNGDKLQQLQNQFFATVLAAAGNNWNVATLAQTIEQLISQFVPEVSRIKINWSSIANTALNAAVSAAPGLLLGMLGKRDATDARLNVNDILALVNKYQILSYIPQIQQFLNGDKLQQLQNQFFATILTGAGNNWNIATIAQNIQQLVSQFVPQIGRFDINWGAIVDSVVSAIPGALLSAAPGLLLSVFGKRDATDARLNVNDILQFVNNNQIQNFIPQIQQFLNGDKLQQLQNQFFATILAGAGNNWNVATIAQNIQQLVSQFVPQIGRFDINWGAIVDSVVSAIPGALLSAAPGLLLSVFGKRDATDARLNLNDVIQFVNNNQIQNFIPQIQQFLSGDKLQQLQNQFFATVLAAAGNNWNVATLAQTIEQLISQFVPEVSRIKINWSSIANTALHAAASAAPSLLIGAVTLIGKRDLGINYQELLAQLPVNKLTEIIQLVKNTDKSKVLATLVKLLAKFFPAYQGRINFDDLAGQMIQQLNQMLPMLSQSLFSGLLG